jgi:5-methylcytosine-specific restriction endonuclease McrA
MVKLHCVSCRKDITRIEQFVRSDGDSFCNSCYRQETTGLLSLRFEILKRDDFTCQYCGRRAPEVILEVDHKVSAKVVGRHDFEKDKVEVIYKGRLIKYKENLITSCRECNRGKGDKLLEKYYETKEKS